VKDIIATVGEFTKPCFRDHAVKVARGDAPFDILIAGGTLVDVVTGELRPADIGIVGPLIVSVHERGARSDAAQVIDATGAFVSPGLIDTHMHIESSMVTPFRLLPAMRSLERTSMPM